jgi:hypothetical protein
MIGVEPPSSVAASLESLGFAVVPLLDAEEVARLRADFDACHPDAGSGFETDFERDDASFKAGVAERTAWVWDRLGPVLPGYAPFMASYLVKWPTPDSQLGLHADWSYVDEDLHPSYAVWVPLVDTGRGIENGPLAVVPGSHRLVRSWRGTATPAWYELGHDGFVAAATPVDAPAGCAVVFDNRLLHHSPPNLGAEPRPVLAGAFAPVGAQLVHVVGDGGETGRILEVEPAFFRDRNPSGLRADRPSVPSDARCVPLVAGRYDPVAIAADLGVDDASAFGPGAGRRWSSDDGRAVPGLDEAVLAGGGLSALPWAPDRIDARPAAAIHLPLVVAGRITPVGAQLLDRCSDDGAWETLRLVRLGPMSELELDLGAPLAGWQLRVIGLEPSDLAVLAIGSSGWAALGPGDGAAVPDPTVLLRNRADRIVAAVVADRRSSTPGEGRLRRWIARFRPVPPAWRSAVELTEAVS